MSASGKSSGINWVAESLQAALFIPAIQTPPDAATLWREMTGSEALNVQRSLGHPPQSQASGAIDAGLVGSIACQPGRVDVFVGAVSTGPIQDHIDDIDGASATLERLVLKAVRSLHLTRVSMVLNLVSPAADGIAATRTIANELNDVKLPNEVSDFVFQVNVPTKVSGFNVNRLCKWASGVQQVFQLSFSNQLSMGALGGPSVVSEQPVALWVIDVNTAPSGSPIPASKVQKLYPLLAKEARAILHEGYLRLVSNVA